MTSTLTKLRVTEAIRQDISGLPKDLQESYIETVEGTYRRLADLLLKERGCSNRPFIG